MDTNQIPFAALFRVVVQDTAEESVDRIRANDDKNDKDDKKETITSIAPGQD